jgi:hypothetical protein
VAAASEQVETRLMSSAKKENKLSTPDAPSPNQKYLLPVSIPHRSIEFRCIVRFGPQLSTPCSRCLEASPPATLSLVQFPVPQFHRYLRCHTFTL